MSSNGLGSCTAVGADRNTTQHNKNMHKAGANAWPAVVMVVCWARMLFFWVGFLPAGGGAPLQEEVRILAVVAIKQAACGCLCLLLPEEPACI